MRIDISTAAEFKSLLTALSDDLVYANIYMRLLRKLNADANEYIEEINQSTAFWRLIFTAVSDAGVLRLCRAYDTEAKSLNLRNLLETIRENLSWFDEPQFRERLKGNPYVDSLAATPRRPDSAQLEKDIEFVGTANEKVKTLVQWRHNAYAHKSPSHALNPSALPTRAPLLLDDIEHLAKEGLSILNRYRSLFEASTDPAWLIGEDDYKSVLEAVRRDLRRQETDIEAEIGLATFNDSSEGDR